MTTVASTYGAVFRAELLRNGRRPAPYVMAVVFVASPQIIRIVVPQLSEERRREMVKVARGKGEDARVTIRSLRRKAMEELHRIVRDGEAGEDEVTRAEKELQGATDRYVHQVDDLVKHKESELLEV